MSRLDINAVRCEALFASSMQYSDHPTQADVRLAIMRTVRDLGTRGCAAQVAQEFGDHPDLAVHRMRWARRLVADTSGPGTATATVEPLRYRHHPHATPAA